jgi:hypothetical protein
VLEVSPNQIKFDFCPLQVSLIAQTPATGAKIIENKLICHSAGIYGF